MRRRNFIKAASLASVSAAIPFTNNFAFRLTTGQKIIKPKRLKKGDTLGLVAPAGFITEKNLNDSIKNLETLGFRVVYSENILAKYGYLGGTDEIRAADLNLMFKQNDVDGIVCARGGYGCSRILPMLDYEMIKNNPKVLIGYSDITSLLYAIFAKTGLVSFHGPVGISTFNEYSVNTFDNVLINPKKNITFFNAEEDPEDKEFETTTIISGSAEGILVGGNLSIVVSLIGTEYDIDSTGKIIFLEEIGEEPYRIDRMLTQMIQAKKFENASGVLLGVFKGSKSREERSGIGNSLTLHEVLFDRLSKLGIPVVYGMSFGHITNKITLPFGIKAKMDSVEKSLTLLEPAVI
jgi:muramoyltetrapeptide carboxypeptidase